MQDILTLVGSYGFPIIMCLLMFWYMIEQRKDHKEETNNLTAALNNNTQVLQKLCDKLGESEVAEDNG